MHVAGRNVSACMSIQPTCHSVVVFASVLEVFEATIYILLNMIRWGILTFAVFR